MLEELANFKPLHIKKNNTTIADAENVLHCLACNKVLFRKLHEASHWIFFFSSTNVRVSVSPERLAIIVIQRKSRGLQSMECAGNKPQLLILPTDTSLRTQADGLAVFSIRIALGWKDCTVLLFIW